MAILGAVSLLVLFFLCYAFSRLYYSSKPLPPRREETPPPPPPEPKPPETVYYIVEKKSKRPKQSFSEPKEINFKK